jgi:hypothetical protein
MYVYTHIYVCIFTYVFMCISVYIYKYMFMYVRICTNDLGYAGMCSERVYQRCAYMLTSINILAAVRTKTRVPLPVHAQKKKKKRKVLAYLEVSGVADR